MKLLLIAYLVGIAVVLFSRWLNTQTWMDQWTGDQATESTVEAGEVCAGMTRPICASGACWLGRHGCCSQVYCDAVDETLIARDIRIERPWLHGLPFMGHGGCVVPPHLRPICSLYACLSLDLSRLPDDYLVTDDDAMRFAWCHARVREGDPFTAGLWADTKRTKSTVWPIPGDYVDSHIPTVPYPSDQGSGDGPASSSCVY